MASATPRKDTVWMLGRDAHAHGRERSRPHLRVIAERQHLAEEGDGLLAQLLRVADVAHHDLFERVLLAVGQLLLHLLSQQHDLATHCWRRAQSVLDHGRDTLSLLSAEVEPGQRQIVAQAKHGMLEVRSGRRATVIHMVPDM